MPRILITLLLLIYAYCCSPHCSVCNNLHCTACQRDYQLTIDGFCTQTVISNCAVYINSSYCETCQPTFALNANNQCEKEYSGCVMNDIFGFGCGQCMFGKILINSICVGTLNCQQNQLNCQKCIQGFTLSGVKCLDTSSACLVQDTLSGVCAMCNQGYVLSGYRCVSNTIILQNCYVYSNNSQCLICKNGYVLNDIAECVMPKNQICLQYQKNGDCISCSLATFRLVNGVCVDPFCTKGTAGNCLECRTGFAPKSNNVCALSDKNCVTVAAGGDRCELCNQGYLINVNGTCSALPANCLAADVVNLGCIQCSTGYLLNAHKQCALPIKISNCVSINQASQNCNLCANGYYISVTGNGCLKVSALCKGYDIKSGMCLGCISGYTNFGGECVDTNCAKKVGDSCVMCKGSLVVNVNSGLCVFQDKNCEIATFNGCNQCKSGYYWNYSKCVPTPSNCQTITNDGICYSCANGYILFNNLCAIPVPNCQSYSTINSSIVCTLCSSGYELRGNICYASVTKDQYCSVSNGSICLQCFNRYFISVDGCVPVNPNCKSYNAANGNCTECYGGYFVSDGACIIANPSTDSNCKAIMNGSCIQCYTGFFLNLTNKKCMNFNPLCKTSNLTNGQCLTCFQGYNLNNGQCLVSYTDANCIKFTSAGQCLNCSSRFFMKYGVCTPINPLCKTYNTTTGNCLTCYPGYFLNANLGNCSIGADPNLDPFCKIRDANSKCTQCYPNYYLSANGSCPLSNPLCKTINNTNGDCLTCYPGYIVKDKTCIIPTASDADANCIKFYSSGNCSSCYVGYYILNGVCTKINILCKTYNLVNGYCLSCYPGYTLYPNGQCNIPQSYSLQASDPYCTSYSGVLCQSCIQGYYVGSSGTCQQISVYCKTFNSKTGKCSECYTGYSLINQNCAVIQQIPISFCQVKINNICTKCMQGYYTQNSMLCSPVSILCPTYDENTGTCLSCISGYFLQSGACVFPSMGYDGNCISYDVSAYCSQCKPGYFLQNYICTRLDLSCSNFDYATNTCLACGNGKQPNGIYCQ